MTRTITITKLNCGKYQVRTDCGLNEGHYEDFGEAKRVAHRVALNVKMAGHKTNIVFAAQ